MKNKSEKASKRSVIWNSIAEAFVELLFYIVAFAAGALVFILLSAFDVAIDSPELIMLVGMIVILCIACLVAIPVYLIKNHIKMKDFKRLHKELRKKHDIRLVIRNKKLSGVRREIPVIKGSNGKGMFELYKDGDNFIFTVEYFKAPIEEKLITEHPSDEAAAIECVEKFMME